MEIQTQVCDVGSIELGEIDGDDRWFSRDIHIHTGRLQTRQYAMRIVLCANNPDALTTERERELQAEIDELRAKLADATKLTIDDDGNAGIELAADVAPAEAE